jgi:hypothetical protein
LLLLRAPASFHDPIPGPGNPKQLSASSGINPIWRKDGKAISYLNSDFGSVWETEVEAKGNDLAVGKTSLLFNTATQTGSYQFYPFDVSADGQKSSSTLAKESWAFLLWPIALRNRWSRQDWRRK